MEADREQAIHIVLNAEKFLSSDEITRHNTLSNTDLRSLMDILEKYEAEIKEKVKSKSKNELKTAVGSLSRTVETQINKVKLQFWK